MLQAVKGSRNKAIQGMPGYLEFPSFLPSPRARSCFQRRASSFISFMQSRLNKFKLDLTTKGTHTHGEKKKRLNPVLQSWVFSTTVS